MKLKETYLSELDLILFSHYHVDHTFGGWVFEDRPKLIHSVEEKALGSLKDFIGYCYATDQLDETSYSLWVKRFLTLIGLDGISSWDKLGFDYIESTNYTNPLDLGATTLEFIHLPGHSPGHTGFYSPNDQILFIGDIVLTARFGPWYGWKNASLPAFRESVGKVRTFVSEHDEIRWVLTSHSRPLTREKALEYIERFESHFGLRQRKIREFIAKNPHGVRESEIANEAFIYGGSPFVSSSPKDMWMIFEKHHVEHHLSELEALGLIYNQDGKYYDLTSP